LCKLATWLKVGSVPA